MKIDIVYPPRNKRRQVLLGFRRVMMWPFLTAAYMCPIMNLAVGGKPWSIVVLWSLWIAWTAIFSPDLVEYNRISQTSKLVADATILLILIGVLLSPGWAETVVPIVSFGGLIVIAALFFSDIRRQKQNMMPMLLVIFVSIVSVAAALVFWRDVIGWEFIVLGSVALAILIACFAVLGGDVPRELKKRFHLK